MHTPSDRVQVRELGQLRAPGTCALCGNGTCLEGYVDFDIYYEWEGQVYLCMNCINQTCEVVGALVPAQAEFLKNTLDSVQKELSETKEQLNVANERLNAYDTIFAGIAVPRTALVGDAGESEPEQSGDTPDAPSAPDLGEPEPPKSVKGRRPANAASSARGNQPEINL